jgi:hypothetical protein
VGDILTEKKEMKIIYYITLFTLISCGKSTSKIKEEKVKNTKGNS